MSENSGFPFEGQELCTQEGKGRYPLHTPPLNLVKHAFTERLLSSESRHSLLNKQNMLNIGIVSSIFPQTIELSLAFIQASQLVIFT